MSTPNNHQISKVGLDFIKGFESFVPYVYDDKRKPVHGQYPEWKKGDPIWGTLTVGYGHTDDAKYQIGFKLRDVPDGFRLTEAQACEILDVDLDECEGDVNSLVKVPITEGEYDALTSFTFNCGKGNLKTLIVPLNRGDYVKTRTNFDHYTRSKGEYMSGLQRRRDGEQVLWDEGDQNLPTGIVEHPAEVDTKPEAPHPVVTFFGSRSIRAGLTGLGTIYVVVHGWWNDLVGTFAIPPADQIDGFVADAQSNIDKTKEVASMFKVNTEQLEVALAIAACVIGYMIIRRFLDRRQEQQQ